MIRFGRVKIVLAGAAAAAVLSLPGCRFGGPGFKSKPSGGMEGEVETADRYSRESHTLSSLAILERAVASYVRDHKIPDTLDVLIPDYLAEIPVAELAVEDHEDTSKVMYYPADIIRGGAIDGTKLKDSGKWGYVHNDHQVIIFVDCIHLNSRGKPWYAERGVF